jgi:RecA-family ATPase
VPELIGEGLTMLCGAPKIGKSWFVLCLSIAAADGEHFLGNIKTIKTETLYLALEDTERRIHNRLKKLNASPTDNLKITTQWHNGYTGLENYLNENENTGLVIIDTLARFANIEDMNDYAMTTNSMARLKRIADSMGIAIVIIHHAKKTGNSSTNMDWTEKALGSTGLTGATDSTILIDRDRGKETKNTATLYATGRDTKDIYYRLKLDLDCGGWTVTEKKSSKDKPTVEDGRMGWAK